MFSQSGGIALDDKKVWECISYDELSLVGKEKLIVFQSQDKHVEK